MLSLLAACVYAVAENNQIANCKSPRFEEEYNQGEQLRLERERIKEQLCNVRFEKYSSFAPYSGNKKAYSQYMKRMADLERQEKVLEKRYEENRQQHKMLVEAV